jgi:hypothetical protein
MGAASAEGSFAWAEEATWVSRRENQERACGGSPGIFWDYEAKKDGLNWKLQPPQKSGTAKRKKDRTQYLGKAYARGHDQAAVGTHRADVLLTTKPA